MKTTTTISIIIVDDHTIFRTGLRMLLDAEPHLKVVDDCASVQEALKSVSLKKPDIVLLDLHLNGQSGMELLPRVNELSEKTNVLVLTGKKDAELHYNCLKLGANGLVLKENSSRILIEAIEKVHQGEVWFDQALMGKMLVEYARPQNNHNSDREAKKIELLSEREREVITLVGEGLKNKAIAERLFIHETTVRHHLTSTFRKLNLTGRLELVIYAFKHNLAVIPESPKEN
jgi:DNA-binding NarL/FixJ family response regulator